MSFDIHTRLVVDNSKEKANNGLTVVIGDILDSGLEFRVDNSKNLADGFKSISLGDINEILNGNTVVGFDLSTRVVVDRSKSSRDKRNSISVEEIGEFVIVEGGGGGSSYTASAVHFDGASWLTCDALTCADNGKISGAVWLKNADHNILFISDPETYVNYLQLSTGDGTIGFDLELANGSDSGIVSTDGVAATIWQCFIWAFDAQSGEAKVYAGDVDITIDVTWASGFSPVFNGLPFLCFGDTFDDNVTGDVADFRIFPGVSFLTGGDIVQATRRLFLDADGKPVDPAVATATLGTSGAVLFSGDATGFAVNQGTGGAFTLTGTLTNAGSSPSD